MTRVTYAVTEHDGGWAYTVAGVFSETFPTRAAAEQAAERAAQEQEAPGETAEIEYQDADGNWHVETAPGGDRPVTDVE